MLGSFCKVIVSTLRVAYVCEDGQALGEYGVTLMVALVLTVAALANFGQAVLHVLVQATTAVAALL